MMTHNKRLYEWTATAIFAAIGLVLALPFRTMEGPLFADLRALAPEAVWATFLITVAVFRAAALYINGSAPTGSPICRAAAAGLGVVTFTVLAVNFGTAGATGLWAASVYSVLACAELVVVHRAVQDVYCAINRHTV